MRLLFVLLFIPLMSFSQLSYNDLMSIRSIDTFKKVAIENGYEFDSADKDWITYGYNIARDSINGNKSSSWSSYNSKDHRWSFQISRTDKLSTFLNTNPDNSNNWYDLIVKDIKEKCKYFKILAYDEIDYVTYSCSESSYKGKIGFAIKEGVGIIRHFPED